jgi:hypothetical protein
MATHILVTGGSREGMVKEVTVRQTGEGKLLSALSLTL